MGKAGQLWFYLRRLLFFILLTVSFLCTIHAQNDSLANYLRMSFEELMNIKVTTAGKQEQQISEIPASVVVITREEIENYGFNTLEEILQSVPGLYKVEQYNWTGMSGIGVRGFFAEGSFSNMVVMVNGSAALREGYINQYILSRIGVPVEAIDRIEIIRGPMSVMYGNGAFFGAINIITNRFINSSKSQVTSMFGSNNTQKYALRVEANSEEMNIAFNLGLYSTDGINQPYSKMTSNPLKTLADGTQKSYLQTVGLPDNATTDHQLSQDIKYFGLTGKYKGFTFDVGTTRAIKGLLWNAPTPDANGQNVYINGSDARLQYSHPIIKHLTVNGLLSFGAYNSLSRYNILATNGTGHSQIHSANIFLEVNGIYKPHNKLDITFGMVRESGLNASNDVDIPSFGVANSSWRIKLGDKIQDYELYSQINYKPYGLLHLVAGVRATKYGDYTYQRIIDAGLPTAQVFEKEFTDDKIHFSGRLASIFKITDKHILKVMYGTAIMSPNMRQNVTRLDLTGGNRTQLEPSSMVTYEATYNAIFSKYFYTTVSLFRNDLDQLIESSGALDVNGKYTVITQNTGRIQTNGMELTLESKPFSGFRIQLSSTYQKSVNKKEGWKDIALGYSPNLLGYLKMAYKITEKFTMGVTGNYVDQMETSWMQQDINPQSGKRYGKKVDGYFCLNANFRVSDIFIPRLFINCNFSNLMNADIYYATDPSNQWADKGFVDYGRRVMIMVGYKF